MSNNTDRDNSGNQEHLPMNASSTEDEDKAEEIRCEQIMRTASAPRETHVATSLQYYIVIEDLKQRGLLDLATEMQRLAANLGNEDPVIEQPYETEKQERNELVVVNPIPKVRTSFNSQPETMDNELDTCTTREDIKKDTCPSKNQEPHETWSTLPPPPLASRAPSQREVMIATGLMTADGKDTCSSQPQSLCTGDTVIHPDLTQLRRNDRSGSSTSHPGAFAVTPVAVIDTIESALLATASAHDTNVRMEQMAHGSQEEDENDIEDDTSSDDVEEGGISDNNEGNDSGALEAVRVDDIMTVKAEPISDDNNRTKLYKTIACVACAVVAVALIVSITLTTRDHYEMLPPDPAPIMYDSETRFRLIRNLLLRRLGPLYEINYNATKGIPILEKAFQTASSPQYRALDWLARTDPDVQSIARPALDDFEEISQGNVSEKSFILAVHGDEKNMFGGSRQRRLLSTPSPPLHDRIVQRYVLAVLFFSTGNWTSSFEFLSAGSECDWSGALLCDSKSEQLHDNHATDDRVYNFTSSGYIIHMDLSSNGLQGTIPLEIAALSHLRSLNFAYNVLTGTLPPSLAALSELQYLDLGFNKFTGTIPDSFYHNWKQLESFIVSESDLSGTISSHIGELLHLKEMRLERNNLGGTIPVEFWRNLTKMENMDLSQQGVKFVNESIGTEIGLWSNLKTFIFHGIELRGPVPSEIGLLTNLTSLQIAANNLSGKIPTELGMLTAVTQLSLSLNALTGTVPTDFLRLTSLTMLYLQNTWLKGNVSFLCKGIEDGVLLKMDPMRVDMEEVSGCYCCTCCQY